MGFGLSGAERALLDSLPSSVIGANADGIIVHTNLKACSLLGYAHPDDLTGKPLTTLMPQRMIAGHEKGFERYRRIGHSRLLGKLLRVPAVRADGDEIEIDLSIRMFRRPDGTDLIAGLLAPADKHVRAIDLSVQRLESDLLERAYALI